MTNNLSINIGEKYIRVVDVSDNGKEIEINSLGEVEANPHYYTADTEKNIEVQAEIINKLLTTSKIKNKRAQVVIPDLYSFSQLLVLPKLNEKELQSAIRYQADQFIPLPIDEVSLDIEVLRENPKTKELTVFIVACPFTIVKQIEKTIELSGLQPEGLENEFSSVRRFILNRGKVFFPNKSSFILVNFGFFNSSIYLIDTQNFILLNRSVKIGLELLLKDIKVNLNIDDKKAYEILQTVGFEKNGSVDAGIYIAPIVKELADEVSHFLIVAKEQYNLNVDQVYIFNLDNMVMSIDKAIQNGISIPVSPFPIATLVKQNQTVGSLGPVLSGFFGAITGALS